jgi:mRNA interferase MazF
LVLADLQGDDIILCQITSKLNNDTYGVALDNADLTSGKLSVESNIRPNRLFTADKKLILYTLGHINSSKYQQVINTIFGLIEL